MRRFAIVLIALFWPAAVAAQDKSLLDLSLEDLLRVQVLRVFGASDRLQPVTEAPSSVTIVTADDIARYGYRTLAEILASARGFYQTNDRNYSYLGVRGFGRAGDYNTRVLLLVNGHRVNDAVYDQAAIGTELGLDPATFERVEIIRGPASSLYGTNAFFAVVNVITRTGASLNGATAEVELGSLGARQARVSYGEAFKNGLDLAVSGRYQRSDGVGRLYFPVFDAPDRNGGIAEGLDGEELGDLYMRAGYRGLTITAAHGGRVKDVPTASYGTLYNSHDPREATTDIRSTVAAQYERALRRTRLTVTGAFDRYRYDGVYPYAGDVGALPQVYRDGCLAARWTIDGRVTRMVGRHTLVGGGELLYNQRQNQWGQYDGAAPDLLDDRSSTIGAAFVQDELKVRPWLLLNGGLRYDAYPAFRRTTPRGAVIVVPSPNLSFKYLYGRAFRAPNSYELYYYPGTDAARLRPESIHTHEIVAEQYVGEWLRTSVASYWNDASQLLSLAPVADDHNTFVFINDQRARTNGVEFEGEVRTKRRVSMLGSYALQSSRDDATRVALSNSPTHLGQFRISVPGPVDRSFASLELQHVGRRTTINGGSVAAATVTNVTINHPLGRSLDLVAGARNVLNQTYFDPASDEHAQDAIEQNGRTLRVGLRWKLWAR